MSEVDARPAPSRGRSSVRGGRGGFGRGGPRGGRKNVNSSNADASQIDDSFDDQGELGEMKKKYASELNMLKDMFPDWTDVDLVFALHESDGDIPSTVDKITQGNVSQFAEVKKPKDRARSKAKEDVPPAIAADKPSTRGGRGRGGSESTRGGRGRGSERGRGGARGGRGGHATTNGNTKDSTPTSIPTAESSAWDTATATDTATGSWDTQGNAGSSAETAGQSAWGNVVTAEGTPAAASEGAKSSLIPDGGAKKSWASMFAQPKAASVPAPAKAPSHSLPAEIAKIEKEAAHEQLSVPPSAAASAIPEQPPIELETAQAVEAAIAPSEVPLTQENVEHLPDESNPPATQTVASTAGSVDTRNITPLGAQPTPIGRPPIGGYAASAYRATGMANRSASYQRRVKEQQEAVVMPGHNAVDRAAVQFGSMGLNGEAGPDVDEDREEPETRQAPQHSPPSQPRTSLPPIPRQTPAAQEMPDGLPTPKQAPGLPPASTQNQQQLQDPAIADQSHPYAAYGRHGQAGLQQDSGAQQQKPYDPFGQQVQGYDQYAHQSQQQQAAQAGFGGLSSAPSDYSNHYTADQHRNAYSQYYGGSYGQQDSRTANQGQAQQDTGLGQQRSASGFGAGSTDTAFASQAQQAQSRYGEQAGSGHNTPNPLTGGQQASNSNPQQSQHSMHQAPSHQQQQGGYGAASQGYPYGHPYYNSPYQQAYQTQFSGYNQPSGYGSYPGKQGGMYGVPHGYGMGSQSSYDQHSSSPANTGAFGQNPQGSMRNASGVASGLSSGLDDYGRSSAQPGSQQSGGFGGINDSFARSGSGFGAQGYGQQSMAGQDDSLKAYADSKGGPSPALGQPGRPGSAANNSAAGQSGLQPPQSQQSGFGGYPGFPGQNQYGGLGGLGTHQQGQQGGMGGQGGYGGYGAGGFGQTYGGYGGRGGWGSNYGAH